MALRICRERDEGNKQAQVETGMPMQINSDTLRRQRMPSPSKFHHLGQPRRDTVSFRNAGVTPSEVERLCLGVGPMDFGRLDQTIAGV
jgi:hypothetical protein